MKSKAVAVQNDCGDRNFYTPVVVIGKKEVGVVCGGYLCGSRVECVGRRLYVLVVRLNVLIAGL